MFSSIKKKSMKKLMFLTMVFGLVMVFSGSASAQSPSTFQKTCKDIKYGVDSKGTPVVQASCLKKDGKTRVTSYAALRGFHNNEGRLTAGAGLSTFQKTCRDSSMEVKGQHVYLMSTCAKTNGEVVKTSTILYDVNNIDGQLQHRVRGNDTVVPPVK